MRRAGKTVCAVAALALLSTAAAQVHVEKGQDGRILVTDQSRGGTVVYAPVGPALRWHHHDGKLEVFDPGGNAWIPAPDDFPEVAVSGGLLLGYGPGRNGSAVYDAGRGAWVPQFDRYMRGAVSEDLAVGFGGPGRIGVYDRRTGQWQSPNITGDQVALSDTMVALCGVRCKTSIYDARRGRWTIREESFGQCTIGNRLAVFYGPPGTNALLYDAQTGAFAFLSDVLRSVQVFGSVAAGLSDDGNAYVYSGEDRKWTEFRWDAARIDIVDGRALITDRKGETWAYRPGNGTFAKIKD